MTEGAKQFSTVTDGQGVYEFPDLADGEWKIRIAMSGFSPLESRATVAPNGAQGEGDLQLLSMEKLLAEAKLVAAATMVLQARALEVKTERKTEASAQAAPEMPPPEEDSEKSSNGLLINGSENNADTSPFSTSPAFGNRHPGIRSLYTGSFGAIADNSVFDARP